MIFTSTFVGYSFALPGVAAYAASKSGLIGLTQALAAEFGPQGVRVNAVLPGAVAGGQAGGSRPFLLDAWQESPLYSKRERAALAWTEALTLVSQTHVPDAVYDEVLRHFAEDELVKLTLLVATINAWNRIAISFRSVHPVLAPRCGSVSPDWRPAYDCLMHRDPVDRSRSDVRNGKNADGLTLASPCATSRPGTLAVGDVRSGSVNRVASVVGEGSV